MFSFNEYLLFGFAYLLSSIPFGLIIVKINGLGNISAQGSGNIGATNVARVAGKKLATLTFLFDFMKGFVPTALYKTLFPENILGLCVISLISVLGHMFIIWLKFKGGKGVATALGAIFAINPVAGLLGIATWVTCFKLTRISSASALCCFGLMPFYLMLVESGNINIIIFSIILCILIYAKHYQNIIRLLKGEEANFKKK